MPNTFRLFISSPFKDFAKEREVLHTRVFPKIDHYCIEQGLSFQPIDLRWGVNNEAQLDQKTLEVCLQEVKACKHFPHPNFLIMAGDRYGYVPLPYMIEKTEFEQLRDYLVQHNTPITISYQAQPAPHAQRVVSNKAPRETTALDLLEQWYKEDVNQIPPEDPNSTAYILQPRSSDYTAHEHWAAEEDCLRELLQAAAEATIADKNSLNYQRYFLSATEEEAIEGIDAYGHTTPTRRAHDCSMDNAFVFGYLRTIEHAQGKYADAMPELQQKANAFKANLASKLLEKNIYKASFDSVEDYEASDLNAFEAYFLQHLMQAIDAQRVQAGSLQPLDKEIMEQTKFRREKLSGFLGRKATLAKVAGYLSDTATKHPLVIYGPSGMGKSALMAKAMTEAEATNDGDTSLLYRFVGATQHSTTLRKLLISLCDELQDKALIDPIESYEPNDDMFQAQIYDTLSAIRKPTRIFIDALDQLLHKDYLQWLPESLPTHLKIVVSILKDEQYKTDSHYFSLFERRVDEAQIIDIMQDSLESEHEALIKTLLVANNRRLQEDQTRYVLKQWSKSDYSPLYLKIAVEEVKHWRSHGARDTQTLNEGVDGIIREFISNLSSLYHHEAILTDKILGYLTVAKDGLSEKELLEILSEDLEDEATFKAAIINKYHDPIRVNNPRRGNKKEVTLPLSTWSRLHTQLNPFLVERDIANQPLMTFFHRQFKTAVAQHVAQAKTQLHAKLADYFLSLQDATKTWDERYHNVHMLEELPYQLYQAADGERLKALLFDLEFAGAAYDSHVQESFKAILSEASLLDSITKEELSAWESFYREKEHLVTRVDKPLWRPHQSVFQLAYEDGDNSPLSAQAEELLNQNKVAFAWLKRRNRPKAYNRTGLIKVLNGHTCSVSDVIVLSNGNILSWSELFGDPVIRNKEGEVIGVLKGHFFAGKPMPIKGAMELKNSSILTWSYFGTLMLWSKEGQCIKTLEGHAESVVGAIELSNDNILSWSEDTTLRLWTNKGKSLAVLRGHTDKIIHSKELSNSTLVSWSEDETQRLWSIDGRNLAILEGNNFWFKGSTNWEDATFRARARNKALRLLTKFLKCWNIIRSFKKEINIKSVINSEAIMLSNENIISWSWDANDYTLKLWNKEGELLSILKGHARTITGAHELSNDNILTWSKDKTLRLWNKKGKCFRTLKGHTGPVEGAKELTNGNLLSWGSGSVKIWSQDGECLVNGHNGWSREVKVLSGGKILFWSDNTLRLWSQDGDELAVLDGFSGKIENAKELRNGNIISWSFDNTLRLWSNNGDILAVMEYMVKGASKLNPRHGVHDVVELSNGTILSLTFDGIMRIWDKNGECLSVLEGQSADSLPFIQVKELCNGTLLSWSSNENILRLWSKEPVVGNSKGEDGHTLSIDGIKELSNGNIISWSSDSTLRSWTKEGQCLQVLKGHDIDDVKELSNGTLLSWSSYDNFRVCSKEGESLAVSEEKLEMLPRVKELSTGNILSWSEGEDKPLKLWNNKGKCLAVLEGHTGGVKDAKELSNGNILSWLSIGLIEFPENTIRLWSKKGKCLAILRGHESKYTRIGGAIELSNGTILSWSGKTLRIWSIEGQCLVILVGHKGCVWGAKELGNGTILSWSDDKTLRIWSIEGQCFSVLEGHTETVKGAIELGNGTILSWQSERYSSFSDLSDHELRIWSIEGKCLAVLEKHDNTIEEIKELSNGTLLSLSADGNLRLWSQNGKLELSYYFPTEHLKVFNITNNLLLSADGRHLSLYDFT